MYSFKIQFLTIKKEIGFVMKSPNKQEVEDFANDLMSYFITVENDKKPIFNTLQNYSEEYEKHLLDFVDKYRVRLPQLNSVSAFFRKLEPNEYFIFLPNMDLEQIEILKLNEYLKNISDGIKYENPSNELLDIYENLLENYQMNTVGGSRVFIGEKNKSRRKCRFCYKTTTATTFNNKAHAISEALGNKTVILFDECDKCNKKFSETIEPDVIRYLSFFRTIYDVKGKGGSKKMKGKNFNLKNDGQINIVFSDIKDRPNPNDKNYNLTLKLQESLIFQNVYKSFCKYFLSV